MPTRDDPRGRRIGSATLRTARNAAALTVAELVGKAFTFAYTVVAARVLGPTEFGDFAYALAISLLVVVVPKWGFNQDVIRRASRRQDELEDRLGASLVWTLALGVVTFTVTGLVTVGSRDGAAAVVLVLMLAATMLDAVSDRLRAGAAALERQQETAVALIANRIVTGIGIVALLLAGAGVVGMGAGYLAGSMLDVVLTVLVVRRIGIHPRLRVGRHALGAAVRGSWVLGLSGVAAMLLFRVDQVIVDALLGSAALAAYVVAYRLVETVLFLSWSVARAVFPLLSNAPEPWRLRRGFARGTGVMAVAYVPFAVVALAEPAASIAAIFGTQYAPAAAPVLQWLAPAPLLFGVAFLGSHVLMAQGRDGWALTSNSVATVANVGLNLALIPRFGIAAAAAVTSLTLAVRVAITVAASGLPRVGRELVGAVWAPVVGGAALALVLVLLDLDVLVELVTGGAVYVLVWGVLARWQSPEEVAVLRRLLPTRRGDPEAEVTVSGH